MGVSVRVSVQIYTDCLVNATQAAEGSRQGHFFGFAFFTADFLAPFLESPAAPSPALGPLLFRSARAAR